MSLILWEKATERKAWLQVSTEPSNISRGRSEILPPEVTSVVGAVESVE